MAASQQNSTGDLPTGDLPTTSTRSASSWLPGAVFSSPPSTLPTKVTTCQQQHAQAAAHPEPPLPLLTAPPPSRC